MGSICYEIIPVSEEQNVRFCIEGEKIFWSRYLEMTTLHFSSDWWDTTQSGKSRLTNDQSEWVFSSFFFKWTEKRSEFIL